MRVNYLRRYATFFIFIILFTLLTWNICCNFSNFDESAHLVGGLSIWKSGSFGLYNVNPPLPRMVATAPLAFFCKPEVDWSFLEKERRRSNVDSRPEFSMGLSFVRANIDNLRTYLILSRLMCLPFALLGAYFCWRWAKELYGDWAGLCSLTLWCFCPNVLTWGSQVMPDVPAASFGVMAGYFFWKWLRESDTNNAFVAGLTLGLALLTKLTWVFLLPLFPMLWIVWYFSKTENRAWLLLRQQSCQMLFVLIVAVFTLNLGYGFEGTFTKLSDYRFASRTLAGKNSVVDGKPGGNRFEGTTLASIPVPLPRNYVAGADLQRVDFEKGLSSYLCGKWQDHGWWYYYIVCAALKIPLGTWGLGILAIGLSIAGLFCRNNNEKSAGWCDQLILLAPAIVLFVFVSSQTGFSRHFRYVLPAFPFAFIWISQVAQIAAHRSIILKAIVIALLSWTILSSLSVYPHSMSYFNELAGGPKNGHKYLLDSNIDWGQDVYGLKRWIEKHPEANDLSLMLRDNISEAFFLADGYPYVPMMLGKPLQTAEEEDDDSRKLGPRPGWFAASIHQIHAEHGQYEYFLDFEPVDRIGYSIYIYNISLDEANKARKRYGLPEIAIPQKDQDALKSRFKKQSNDTDVVNVALFYAEKHDENATRDLERLINADPQMNYNPITSREIRSGGLTGADVVVFPGGNARDQAHDLGAAGKKAIRDFVERGGGYVGICAGGFLAATNTDYGLSLANVKARVGYRYVPNEGLVSMTVRGAGEVDLEWTTEGKELLSDLSDNATVSFTGGPIFSNAYRRDLPEYMALANYTSEVSMYAFQEGEMIGTPVIILAPYGKGHVVLTSGHFEFMEKHDRLVLKLIRGVKK